MPSNFFSPLPENRGAALYVSFNSKDGAMYFKLIKQTNYDIKTKKGTFRGGAITNVKFSEDETGGFIEAIRNRGKFTFYHQFESQSPTSGQFNYYERDDGRGGRRGGFGLTLKKDNIEYKVGFSVGGAERLMEYLKFALNHINSATYSKDKKEAEAWAKQNGQQPSTPQQEEQNSQSDGAFDLGPATPEDEF
jgi:hypothetical protein